MEVKILHWKSLEMEKLLTFRDKFIPILEITNNFKKVFLFTVTSLCFYSHIRKGWKERPFPTLGKIW